MGCRTQWGGRSIMDECDECGHMLVAHRPSDWVCSLCEIERMVREYVPQRIADDVYAEHNRGAR